MNKYYCTGEEIENGYLKVVVPEIDEPTLANGNLKDGAHEALNNSMKMSIWKKHLSSLPLAALVVGGKTGWLEGYEERYEAYSNTTGWTEVPYRVWLDIDSEKRTVLTKITNDMIVGQARCPHCGYITSTGGIIEHIKHCQKRMKAHPIEVPDSDLPPHLIKKPEEKSEEVCSCGVPLSLHNTCCGWGNANLIVFQWEKTISFGPDDAKKRYEISQLPPEQQEAAFKQHFGNIISVPPNAAAPQSSHLRWVKYKDRKPTKDGYYVCKCYYEQSDVVAGALYMEFKEGGFWSEDEVYNLEWLEQTQSTDQDTEAWEELVELLTGLKRTSPQFPADKTQMATQSFTLTRKTVN